jgi:predicted ATPase/predicted negative regulator of RcsB-dependent stress response
MMSRASELIGKDPRFVAAIEAAETAAGLDAPILIYGETGAGKGRFAEYAHKASGRSGRFVSLNCATFQPSLFESELFGYMRGSFTGAVKDSAGLFETASGGTLFLDEIGDTPLEIQPKLLRALEEGVIRRVGGRSEISVDVRLICATNRNLKELIKAGRFREDLYYRINSFVVTIPPLRERPDDIPELAAHFLDELGARDGKVHTLSAEAADVLRAYRWPGNVRELRSAMAYAHAQAGKRSEISAADLPDTIRWDEPEETEIEDAASLFRDLYRSGIEDARGWAQFLLAFNAEISSTRFARGDILPLLRSLRGPEPTDNALVNEWQRHIKPMAIKLGLIREDGKKVVIELDACRAALKSRRAPREVGLDDLIGDTPVAEVIAPRPATRSNVPAPRTSFIGRDAEVKTLTGLVQSQVGNLVTVTGPGGTGKTRIAQEAARKLVNEFPGGAWFVDLTESRNIEGLAYAVAHALSVPLTGMQAPENAVGQVLEAREPTLLVLDNMEQLVNSAAGTLGDWVRRAPQVKFLVTSRAILGIEGEREFELGPLTLPDSRAPLAALAQSDSVRLFVERARLQNLSFKLDPDSAAAVAAICERLEGMPLAIELAAARTSIMHPQQIAERLDKMFALLKSSRRDLHARQQSLSATIEWSFNLLDEAERLAFLQLSVMRGGFFLEAAERILDMSSIPAAPDALDLVQALRDKSLLRAQDTPYEARFYMYDAIREYAQARWEASATPEQQQALEDRHANFFRAYIEKWDKRIYTRDAVEALDRLELSRPNAQAAMDRAEAALERPGNRRRFVELVGLTANLLRVRGPARRRVPLLRRALELCHEADRDQRLKLLLILGAAEREAGEPALADPLFEEAAKLARELGMRREEAMATLQMAGGNFGERKFEGEFSQFDAALRMFREVGDRHNEARTLSRMSNLLVHHGKFAEALGRINESESILRELEDFSGVGMALNTRGNIFYHHQDYAQALEQYEAAFEIFNRLNDRRMQALMGGNRALMTRQLRRLDEALVAMQETGRLAAEMGDQGTLATNLMNMGLLLLDLDQLDEAEQMFKQGAELLQRQGRASMWAVCVENIGNIAARRGDTATAHAKIAEAMRISPPDETTFLEGIRVSLAELLLQEGKRAEAAREAAQARAHFEAEKKTRFRDYFRACVAEAEALKAQGVQPELVSELKQKALQTAEYLKYSDTDPARVIRVAMEFLKNL